MTFLLLLCGLALTAEDPLPLALEFHYREQFACHGMGDFTDRYPEEVAVSPDELASYFPSSRQHWPVVSAESEALQDQVLDYTGAGVRPALILPPRELSLISNTALLKEIRDAVRLGAVPVATLERTSVSSQSEIRNFWCSLDTRICPQAWYLVDGVDETVARLSPSLYLATHWTGVRDWPLPDRVLDIQDRQVWKINDRTPMGGGRTAVREPAVNAFLVEPDMPVQNWTLGWIPLEQHRGQISPRIVSDSLYFLSGLSLKLWEWLKIWLRLDPLIILTQLLAWISIIFVAGSLIFLVLRRPKTIRPKETS